TWQVNNDFENVLRSMQRVHDRQKTLAVHGAALSDGRLPVRTFSFRERKAVEGRVLVHGEEENGRAYLMLEGTDGCVHHIPYTPEIEEARARGLMKTNAFVRLRKENNDSAAHVAIDNFGDSEALLRDHRHFRQIARRTSLSSGPAENNWGGWLG